MLDLPPDALDVVEIPESEARGPGNAVMIELAFEHVAAVPPGFGKKGTPAGEVAAGACRAARDCLDAEVPVGPRLADQLLVPLAAASGGRFVTVEPTSHTRTNAAIVERFTGQGVEIRNRDPGAWIADVPG